MQDRVPESIGCLLPRNGFKTLRITGKLLKDRDMRQARCPTLIAERVALGAVAYVVADAFCLVGKRDLALVPLQVEAVQPLGFPAIRSVRDDAGLEGEGFEFSLQLAGLKRGVGRVSGHRAVPPCFGCPRLLGLSERQR